MSRRNMETPVSLNKSITQRLGGQNIVVLLIVIGLFAFSVLLAPISEDIQHC